jgi:hypothetical protein
MLLGICEADSAPWSMLPKKSSLRATNTGCDPGNGSCSISRVDLFSLHNAEEGV